MSSRSTIFLGQCLTNGHGNARLHGTVQLSRLGFSTRSLNDESVPILCLHQVINH